ENSPKERFEQGFFVELWDAEGQEIRAFHGHAGEAPLAFSPDGKLLAAGSKTVKVWDVRSGQEVLTGSGHVLFSPDGKRLAIGPQVWELATDKEVMTLKGPIDDLRWMAFSPDSKHLASVSPDKTVKVWDTASGQEILTLKGHTSWVTSVAFSPDGKRLATASADMTVKLWVLAGTQGILTLRGRLLGFHPDGCLAISADRSVKLCAPASGKEIQ